MGVGARTDGDADGSGGEDLRPVQIVRRREHLLHAARGVHGLLRIGEVAEQQGELVAAEARHGVAGPDDLAQPLRDLDQQHVAPGVAEALVDGLEAIDVEEQHREPVVFAATLERERLSEAVDEERPVR